MSYSKEYYKEWIKKYPHGKNPVGLICLNCSKKFFVKPYRATKAKACSMSCAMYLRNGELSPAWKGGKTDELRRWRSSNEAKQWRKSVFERDSYTCTQCGDNAGGNLNADHIKPAAYYPELRAELSNGRTLCVPCHKQTPTWGSKSRKLYAQGAFN
jgi:hypothetical protein